MDEMQIVKGLRSSTPAITAEADDLARARLLAAVHASDGRRTAVWRVAMAGALAAAVAIGFTVMGTSSEPSADAAVVQVLDHATRAASARPFTTPRPDQWVYQHVRTFPQHLAALDFYRWTRVGGTLIYEMLPQSPGKPTRVSTGAPMFPPQDYATLSTLPTKPSALLGWLSAHRPAGDTTTDFQDLTGILTAGAGLLPPKVEAAIFQAMKKLPGVSVRRGVKDPLGRAAIGVIGTGDGRVGDVALNVMVLLDPETYGYLGNESFLSADDVYRTKEGVTKTIKAGTVDDTSAILERGIVNALGQKP